MATGMAKGHFILPAILKRFAQVCNVVVPITSEAGASRYRDHGFRVCSRMHARTGAQGEGSTELLVGTETSRAPTRTSRQSASFVTNCAGTGWPAEFGLPCRPKWKSHA